MNTYRVFRSFVAASVCALALVAVAGCSSAPASSSAAPASSASESASSIAAESSASASAVGSSTAASAASPAATASASSSASGLKEDDFVAQGYQVFEGTVHVCSVEELINLQELDVEPDMVGHGGTYAVLVFDQPTNVTGESADGSGQRTESATMLGVAEHTDYDSFVVEYGDLTQWEKLNGQKVKIAAKAKLITFPSDVRLPLGEPATDDAIVL